MVRNARGEKTQLWESVKVPERTDLNLWQRVAAPLLTDEEFRVVWTATVGTAGEGDIALDDISFTPGCM